MLSAVGRSILTMGLLSILGVQAVWARESSPLAPLKKGVTNPEVPLLKGDLGVSSSQISRICDLKRPATTLKDWMAQVEAATVQVTNVKLERTDSGLDITLETGEGKPLQVDATKFRSEGNSLIADIPNAVLVLTNATEFSAQNPTEDIATVRVIQVDANTIRVNVAGTNALPQSEVTLKTGGLAYSLNPGAEEPDEEIVVTGEGQRGYRVPNTSVGTRTDTPLRDIPQSIQIVPQQVLEDQNVTTFNEALRNVPSVSPNRGSTSEAAQFSVRGFRLSGDNNEFLRNGLRDFGIVETQLAPNIERFEVLLGPASVLYGTGNPGGTINVVTKQPLRDPFYAVDATIGNYDFYRGAIDLSGPLNNSRTLLYRLNLGYLNRDSFVNLYEQEKFAIAPVFRWDISDRTHITLEGEYTNANDVYDAGLPAVGTALPNPNGRIPRGTFTGDPDGTFETKIYRVGYRLEHQFSDNWSIQNAFQVLLFRRPSTDRQRINFTLDADNRTLNGILFQDKVNSLDTYDLNVILTGKFSTGSIGHQLILGTDLGRFDRRFNSLSAPTPPLDVFNPVYGLPAAGPYAPSFVANNLIDTLGIYLQDQVTLALNLKLLLGGRFDLFKQNTEDFLAETKTSQSGNGFSPRVGIVYQPIPPISLYASYSRSLAPVIGRSLEGDVFQPERGTQYEVGVKAELQQFSIGWNIATAVSEQAFDVLGRYCSESIRDCLV